MKQSPLEEKLTHRLRLRSSVCCWGEGAGGDELRPGGPPDFLGPAVGPVVGAGAPGLSGPPGDVEVTEEVDRSMTEEGEVRGAWSGRGEGQI